MIISRIHKTVDLIVRITEDLQTILGGIEETSSAMEGISASTEQQTASVEEVSSTANRLGSLAEELRSELEIFKLSSDKDLHEDELNKSTRIKGNLKNRIKKGLILKGKNP